MNPTASTNPLHGLRVIEFGHIAAGPFAGSLLADLGADVVKIERTGKGDGLREWPPIVDDGSGARFSGNFAALNRNKKSVTADLTAESDRNFVRELCTRADIVLENYRPGVLKRFHLDYDALFHVNPKLVYCSVSGYGQTGPYANQGAFDVTIQALSGLMSVTGDPEGNPAKAGVPIADFVAGLYAAYSILACVLDAKKSGKGRYVDVSMLGAVLGISALQTSEYFGTQRSPQRLGTAHPRNAPYQGFPTRDEMIVVAAGNDSLWKRLCSVLDVDYLTEDPRFTNQGLRALNQNELATILSERFMTESRDHWLKALKELGIPAAPINTYEQALEDPQVKELGIIGEVLLPGGAQMPTVLYPIGISDFEPTVRRQPPRLGSDNDSILDEWSA